MLHSRERRVLHNWLLRRWGLLWSCQAVVRNKDDYRLLKLLVSSARVPAHLCRVQSLLAEKPEGTKRSDTGTRPGRRHGVSILPAQRSGRAYVYCCSFSNLLQSLDSKSAACTAQERREEKRREDEFQRNELARSVPALERCIQHAFAIR